MKKILALVMALALVLSMAACGSAAASSAAETAASAETPAAEAPAAEAPAAEAPAAEGSAAEAAPAAAAEVAPMDCEPLEITFNTTYNETETGGQLIHEWIDKLNELSNGNITVNVYWGGTVFGDLDVLDALESGAINMTTFGHMPHTGTLNYLGFPGWAPGGTQAALDYFNTLCFEDPETSKLIQDELAEHNIIFLNVLPGGANAFCTTYEFTDLASMVSGSKSFGNMTAPAFEALGFQVTSVGPGDCYDALQRGLIDGTQMGLAPMVSMQWYDVAPYWALDGTYGAGNFVSANLDWWNTLSEDQQTIIKAASDYLEISASGMYDADIETAVKSVEDATGNAFVTFNDDDIAAIWAAIFSANADSAYSVAEANGKADGMKTILEKAAEITGTTWAPAA